MKTFEQHLNKINEEETFNTEKETKLKAHEEEVQTYNANKTKFVNIFSKDEKGWEEEASKIIDGNVYLGIVWKMEKIKNNIKGLEDKLNDAEMSDEEKKSVEEQITDNKDKIQDQEKELNDQIGQDLNDINSL